MIVQHVTVSDEFKGSAAEELAAALAMALSVNRVGYELDQIGAR